jgi:hypothetical protein
VIFLRFLGQKIVLITKIKFSVRSEHVFYAKLRFLLQIKIYIELMILHNKNVRNDMQIFFLDLEKLNLTDRTFIDIMQA